MAKGIPDTLWAALRHGDVFADGMTLRQLGSRTVLGYLQPSAAMLDELRAYRGERTVPASTLASDPRIVHVDFYVGGGLLPGLTLGGIPAIDALLEHTAHADPFMRNDLAVSLARARDDAARLDELLVMARSFRYGGDSLAWRVVCTRARIETALAADRLAHARDAALELAVWLQGRNAHAHLTAMRDAAALCSLLLARGIDSRGFVEEIRRHNRAELLLFEAI